MCVERVEQGAKDTALWGSYVQGDGVGGELAHFQHLWSLTLYLIIITLYVTFLTFVTCHTA